MAAVGGCSPSELGDRWSSEEFEEIYQSFQEGMIDIPGVRRSMDPMTGDEMEALAAGAFGNG